MAPEDKEKVAKTDQTLVPTTHHPMPDKFYEEMVHTVFVKCVIDLTPMSGKFAWAALKAKVGYVGIVPTSAASAALKARLTSLLKVELATPGSKLYSNEYALALDPKAQGKDKEKEKVQGSRAGPQGAESKKTAEKGQKGDKPETAAPTPKTAAPTPKPKPKKKAKVKQEEDAEADDNEGSGESSDVWDPLADDVEVE